MEHGYILRINRYISVHVHSEGFVEINYAEEEKQYGASQRY